MAAKRVLSVGQCFADHSSISRVLQQLQAQVVRSDTAEDALDQLRGGQFDLVLVNRVFDYDGDSGLEVIRRIKADEKLQSTPVMLVSNYEDAQRQAADLGALPGFGKAALGTAPMLARVREVLT